MPYELPLKAGLRLQVAEFKGKAHVDLRHVWTKDGQTLPTKKGVSLSPAEWQALQQLDERVQQAWEELAKE